jgi:hypothetical protein
MTSRLDAEQIFCVEAGRIAAAGLLATKDDIARLARAMEAARPYMNDEIRTRIFDHCAEICREGASEARAQTLLDMLHERIVHLTQQRGPWYSKEGLMG